MAGHYYRRMTDAHSTHEHNIVQQSRGAHVGCDCDPEKQREKENERGDSGGTWPSVRRGRASAEKTKTEMAGRSAIQALARGVGRAILPAAAFEAALPTDSRAVAHGERQAGSYMPRGGRLRARA